MLIAISTACFGQWKPQPLPLSLTFISGTAKGLGDVLEYHFPNFQRLHPNANPQFWNPNQSWVNKYKNNDPAQGEKFFGSTTFGVVFTDAIHPVRSIQKFSMIGAVVCKIGDKQPFLYYLYDLLSYSLAYSLGFCLVYEIIYR